MRRMKTPFFADGASGGDAVSGLPASAIAAGCGLEGRGRRGRRGGGDGGDGGGGGASGSLKSSPPPRCSNRSRSSRSDARLSTPMGRGCLWAVLALLGLDIGFKINKFT